MDLGESQQLLGYPLHSRQSLVVGEGQGADCWESECAGHILVVNCQQGLGPPGQLPAAAAERLRGVVAG